MQASKKTNIEENSDGFLRRHSIFALPLSLTVFLGAFAVFTPARNSPPLIWSICGAAGALFVWQLILLRQTARSGRRLSFDFVPVRAHYIQATLHLSVFVYWGYYWRNVYEGAHLIVAQIVFLYIFDMLLCWSRGKRWRLGFGPLPIIFSTNLFLLFKPDWFIFQFLMVATGALGKEFIQWKKDGKKTHIFNPSGFSLSVFSIVLLLTGTTEHTWGFEIATTLNEAPHIYLWIFLIELVVQALFSVTLMTLSAAAFLWILNLIYTQATGVYFFIDSNIPIAVFLGLHLLVTDPSTSPKTNVGRILFGGLYGLAVTLLYALLAIWEAPQFYDKLLCVPLLNLSVVLLDRVAGIGVLGKITAWTDAMNPRRFNLLNMSGWVALFGCMLGTGFVGSNHEGGTIAFWERACEKGQRHACEKLIKTLDYHSAEGSALASNRLGVLLMEGKATDRNPEAAGRYFKRACEQGSMGGCCNLTNLYLHHGHGNPEEVARAIDHLEAAPELDTEGRNSYLIGLAYAYGRGSPLDKNKALEFYRKSCHRGWRDGCIQLAKMLMFGDGVPVNITEAAGALEKSSEMGDAMSSYYLAGLLFRGEGVPRDQARAIVLLKRACAGGLPEACDQLRALEQLPKPQ